MSEKKVDTETVRKQYTNDPSLIDEVEIIDVSASDFDDTNVWLYMPPQCYIDTSIHNLYVWLKSESELILPGNRRSIDTRTFTRPKKRTSRINFESISEAVSPPISNTWKSSYPSFSHSGEYLNKQLSMPVASKVENVPPMLKMPPKTYIYHRSDVTSDESMEIFVDMSHSNGIDSFINLVEPVLNEPLMNVSQPSILYSSITSLPRDDSLPSGDCNKKDVPANLNRTFSQRASINEDVKNLHGNETLSLVDEPDNNKSHCLPAMDTTFNKVDNIQMNETYNANDTFSHLVLCPDKDKHSTINLSSMPVNEDDGLRSENDKKNESCNLNATYNAEAAAPKQTERSQACSPHKNTVPNVVENLAEPSLLAANLSYTIKQDITLAMFNFLIPPGSQSTPKNMLNSASTMNSTVKAPTSLRKELLAEIHRNADHKLDGTYNCVANDLHAAKTKMGSCENVRDRNAGSNMPEQNKYNTYKKEPSRLKAQVEMASDVGGCVPNAQDKKYYTFTKKGSVHGGKTDMENAESLENADATFVKPFPNLQKRKQQQHIPRMLSKLPQFLQKSNPNLVSSSLKKVSKIGCANATNIGYMKGSQPNIVEKSVTNKLHALGNVKSGSEQRLLELNTGELQMMGAGGSTESIESTQSAHSAPDLDDRLSTCSDSSHNSYTVQPMNIEQLHQIVRMQEESLKQDAAPLLNKCVMDNTWTEEEQNLPSPIQNHGTDGCESDSSSLKSMHFNVKTSSPLISPTRCSQPVNADDHPMERMLKQQNETDVVKKAEVFNKPTAKFENKTKMRPPTNWSTGNRPVNTLSAIPRPPSRIPGPRAVRSAVKTTQGDVKRGYM